MFLHNYTFDFYHFGLSGKIHTFIEAFDEKNVDFDTRIKLFKSPKIPKSAISFKISRHSDSFLVTTGLIILSRFESRNLHLKDKI